MSNEIVVGNAALAALPVVIATLTAWAPFVDVYVDGANTPSLPGSKWELYAVTGATRTRFAAGLFNTTTPLLGQRVISVEMAKGDTIELEVSTPHPSATLVRAALVGWDPATITPNAEDSGNSTAVTIPTGPEVLIGAIPWHPNVSALVEAPANAAGSKWTLKAILPTFTKEIPIVGAIFLPSVKGYVVAQGRGGCSSWKLYCKPIAGTAGPLDASIFGNAESNNDSASGSVAGRVFVFREGAPTAAPYYSTFSEAHAAAKATGVPETIWFDNTFSPAMNINDVLAYDLAQITLAAANEQTSPIVVNVQGGAQFLTPSRISGLSVQFLGGTANPMIPVNAAASAVKLVLDNGAIVGESSGTPTFDLAANLPYSVELRNGSRIEKSNTIYPMINTGVTGIFNVDLYDSATFIDDYGQAFSGTGTANVNLYSTAAIPPLGEPGAFVGTYNLSDFSNNTPSGTTLERPTFGLVVGRRYFDTTLNLPIWWTGAAWINAAGVVV